MSFKQSLQSVYSINPQIIAWIGGGICVFYTGFIHFMSDFQKNLFSQTDIELAEMEPYNMVYGVLGKYIPYLLAFGIALILLGFLIKVIGKASSILHVLIFIGGLVGLFFYFQDSAQFYESFGTVMPEELDIVNTIMKFSMYSTILSMLLFYVAYHFFLGKSIQYTTNQTL